MKNNFIIIKNTHIKTFSVYLLLNFCALHSFGGLKWSSCAGLPGFERRSGADFAINNKGYIFGGVYALATAFNDLWEYDPVTDAWTQKANCPGQARYSCVGFSINGKGYITTGWTWPAMTQLNDCWEYDPAINNWTQKNNFLGSPRYTCASFVLNGYAYVGLGFTPLHNDFYKYDPVNDTWSQIANFPGGSRQSPTCFELNSKAYLVGGDNGTTLNDAWEFDPAANSWTAKTSYPHAMYGGAGFAICGKGYVGFGNSQSANVYNDLWQFDPSLNVWNAMPTLPDTGRMSPFKFVLNNRVYIVGGMTGVNYSTSSDNWRLQADSVFFNDSVISCTSDVQFISSPSNATYTWYFGDGDSSTVQNPLHHYLLPGNYNVTLIVNQECFADTVVQQITTSSFALSSALFGVLVDSCNRHIQLYDSSINAQFYLWNFGDGDTSILQNPSHTYLNDGTYTITLITTGCGSDTAIVTVNVYSNPEISLGSDTTLCTGDTLMLFVKSGYTNYLWQDGSSDSSYAVIQSGNYFVMVSNNGCIAIDSITVQFVSCLLPIINFASSDTNFCEKNCIDFYDLSTNNPTSWQWYFPGGIPDTSTLQNPTGICYNAPGNFDVTLYACNNSGCDSLSINQFINEFQNPIDSIWVSNDTLFSLPFITYQWYEVTSGALAGEINSFFVPSQIGSYYCLATDSLGCVATSNTIVLTAIQSEIYNSQFAILPNPNNGNFEIMMKDLKHQKNSFLRVIDGKGTVVFEQSISNHISNSNVNIDLNLPDGIYLIQIIKNEKVFLKKFIVAKN